MQAEYSDLELLLEMQQLDLEIMRAKKQRIELPQRIKVMMLKKKRDEIAEKLDHCYEESGDERSGLVAPSGSAMPASTSCSAS